MCTPSNLDSWIQNYCCRCQTFKRNEMTHKVKNDITWESSRVRALFDEERRVRRKNRGRGKGPEGGNSFSRALSIAVASLFWAEECCKPISHYVLDVCITRRNCLVCKCSIFYSLWKEMISINELLAWWFVPNDLWLFSLQLCAHRLHHGSLNNDSLLFKEVIFWVESESSRKSSLLQKKITYKQWGRNYWVFNTRKVGNRIIVIQIFLDLGCIQLFSFLFSTRDDADEECC